MCVVQFLSNYLAIWFSLAGRTDEDKISCCKQVVQELVEPNKTVFLFLMDFLVKVSTQLSR